MDIIFFCRLNLPSNELLRNFYDIFDITRCTKSRAEKILLSSEKKNLIYLYISIRFLWNVYILLFLLCFIYFYETPSIWPVNLLTKMK